MKIILVNPSLTAKEQAGNLEVVENVMRSLGIGYIAAVLEKNNFNVEIIDSRVDRLSEEQLIAQLNEKNPDVIGFTSTILEINRVVKLSNKIKKEKLFPNSRDREIVKRLNRMNMPVKYRSWIVVPTNLGNINNLSLSPFPSYRQTNGWWSLKTPWS